MSENSISDFGVVEEKGDFFEFRWVEDATGKCSLDAFIQTERGPRRTELAIITTHVWKLVSERTIRELVDGMGKTERTKEIPILKIGINRLSPMIGRELAVLLWALMETTSDSNIEAILHSWRELAREERWWLYAKAAGPGQRAGSGWRLALFHALSDMSDSRSAEPVTYEKKKFGSGSRSPEKSNISYVPEPRKKAKKNNLGQKMSGKKSLPKPTSRGTTHSKKRSVKSRAVVLTKSKKKKPLGKKEKKTSSM